jgi:hypothetical protein
MQGNKILRLCYRNYGNKRIFQKLPMQIITSSLLCINIFFCLCVKAIEANLGSDEAIKCKLKQKIKQWSDKAFYAGKEIEAMKRLTLHCIIASSLLVPSFGGGVRDGARFKNKLMGVMVYF